MPMICAGKLVLHSMLNIEYENNCFTSLFFIFYICITKNSGIKNYELFRKIPITQTSHYLDNGLKK